MMTVIRPVIPAEADRLHDMGLGDNRAMTIDGGLSGGSAETDCEAADETGDESYAGHDDFLFWLASHRYGAGSS